ncbi:MAG: glycosyltransferase [Oscillospiraceae bacterium]|nr:glycosyltransferase [Oscillospiraceae bacterium]
MYSVLMSLYSGEKSSNLKQSIDSILNQTAPPDQIVVVKDGPLTAELENTLMTYCSSFPRIFDLVVLEENSGLGAALREGVLACKNEWIARMDTDDIAVNTRMETQLSYLKEHPRLDMLGSLYYEFFDDISNHVLRDSAHTHDDLVKFMHRRNPFGHDTLFLRKSMVLKAGNYRPVNRFEDYDLWIRMVQCGVKMYNLEQPLLYVRSNRDYFARRGGFAYLKSNISFFLRHHRTGFFTVKDCIFSLIPRCVVCLMPNGLRSFIYKNFLRNNELEA